ncbi:enoyl-CoA hydratase/carnithine racemase [Methylopila jiangsuensis]|uniref:enoyl-CoA hydratase/isomerase family protein n=1 Tax=Methylopila jiangsuensis TaxID=586230 RepID=UPI0022F2E3A7|nr:enoyl-CoA hydratase-related protein [Methylopila jiangsuensis]MDR6285731.1 enoyl-CoA hydratase/carnithine racemase [Methylopila jiangsuensis]
METAASTVEGVTLSRRGPVATVLLNRPAKKNAFNEAAWRGFPKVAAEIAAGPDIRAVVMRGAGGVFSAGADIAEFVALSTADEARRRSYADAVRDGEEAVAAIAAPTVAAIEGPCVGGGCQIALACDLRIAASDARFGITPAKLGIVYPVESTRRLVNAVGPARAKELLFTARLIDAEEALAIGLVHRVAPPGELDAVVSETVAAVSRGSAYSLFAAKRMIDALSAPSPDFGELDELWRGGFAGEDLKEGARAFMDKRAPLFTWRPGPAQARRR